MKYVKQVFDDESEIEGYTKCLRMAIHIFILGKYKSRQIWVYIEEFELTEVTWK